MPPADGSVEAAGLAEGVEEGQTAHDDVIVGDVKKRVGAHGSVVDEVGVSQLCTLGVTDRPRRVEDHRGVLGVALGHVGVRIGRGNSGVEPLVDVDHRCTGVARSLDGRLDEAVPGHDDRSPGVAKVEAHLASLEQRVHRDHDTARAEQRVVGNDERRHIGQHDPDTVTRLVTLLAQHGNHAGGSVLEFPVGHRVVVELDGDGLRTRSGGAREEGGEVGHVISVDRAGRLIRWRRLSWRPTHPMVKSPERTKDRCP